MSRTKLQLKPLVSPPAATPTPAPAHPAHSPEIRTQRPDRAGKKLIAGHFPTSVARRLKIIAASNDRTVQSLLDEALTDLLVKYEA